MVDPPWRCGYDPRYPTLADRWIEKLPVGALQTDGYILMWVVNAKENKGREMIESWGYTYKDKFTWGKLTNNNKPVNGSGFYLRHSTETCIVGKKGFVKNLTQFHKVNDLILAQV